MDKNKMVNEIMTCTSVWQLIDYLLTLDTKEEIITALKYSKTIWGTTGII